MPSSIYKRWLGTSHLESTSPPSRRAEEVANGITSSEGSPGLLRSRLTPSYLGDRSTRSGRAGKRAECNEKGEGRGQCNGQSPY
jgi:hypothetical protein